LLENLKVSDAMVETVICVSVDTPVRKAGLKIKETKHRGFPVLDKDRKLFGIVTYKDINWALRNGKAEIPVKEICTKEIEVCYPDESLRETLEKLGEKNIGRLPVVKRDDKKEILGLLTRKSIVEAYHIFVKEKTGFKD
jgi:CIC family chloride channel protein